MHRSLLARPEPHRGTAHQLCLTVSTSSTGMPTLSDLPATATLRAPPFFWARLASGALTSGADGRRSLAPTSLPRALPFGTGAPLRLARGPCWAGVKEPTRAWRRWTPPVRGAGGLARSWCLWVRALVPLSVPGSVPPRVAPGHRVVTRVGLCLS
ncbi:hypothetical protein KPATCC21470_6051 [Kitasatospora purpeofusca]